MDICGIPFKLQNFFMIISAKKACFTSQKMKKNSLEEVVVEVIRGLLEASDCQEV